MRFRARSPLEMAGDVVSSSACLNLSPRSFKPRSLAFEHDRPQLPVLVAHPASVDVHGSEHDRGPSNCDAVRLQPHVSARVALDKVPTRNTPHPRRSRVARADVPSVLRAASSVMPWMRRQREAPSSRPLGPSISGGSAVRALLLWWWLPPTSPQPETHHATGRPVIFRSARPTL